MCVSILPHIYLLGCVHVPKLRAPPKTGVRSPFLGRRVGYTLFVYLDSARYSVNPCTTT